MTKIEQLIVKKHTLTTQLKAMSGLEPNYGEVWDRRVDVINALRELENKDILDNEI